MKKWFLLNFLILSWSLEALPLGNPADAYLLSEGLFFKTPYCESLNFRLGYYGDFVFDRNLRVEKNADFATHLRRTKIYTNAGYLTANFFDRIDLFTTLGATRIVINADQNSWLESPDRFPEETFLILRSGFSWSLGARAALLNWKCWTVGVEGQYFSANPTIHKYLNFIDARERYLDGSSTYCEWQVGGALSYEIRTFAPYCILVPYLGAKWAHVRFDSNDFSFATVNADSFPVFPTIFNCRSQYHWGFPFGVTLLFNQNFDFTLEGRFGDETAFTFMAQGRF